MRLHIGPYPLTRGEVSGALADLGVLLPLEAALIAVNGVNPTSTLLGVGIIYIAAGWYFRLPMPVQPLKALSVVAIAQALSPSVVAAGALLMSGALVLLAATRAIEWLNRAVPPPVVRGVQFALGLLLIESSLSMVLSKPFLVGGGSQMHVSLAGAQVSAGLLVGLGSLGVLLLLLWRKVLPAAATVVALGVVVGLVVGGEHTPFALGPAAIRFALPSPADFATALVLLVVPQLPLTLANSVIATVDAARTYYGAGARRVTPTRTSLSIALSNLWAGLFGGLPVCHGSGGLTAHYRLGARTPAAGVVIGVLLVALALLFGRSAIQVRSLMPYAVLGALLLYVGIQHLLLGLRVQRLSHLPVVALVGALTMVPFGNMAIGAGAGLVAYWLVRWSAAWVRRQRPALGQAPASEAAHRR